jgi:AcrR family transcriptional regulator
MYIHLEQDGKTDPRILRTRELLINSFATLLIENKSIRKVSVQTVTEKAGVNRVTFYAHFSDKYDLLDVWARLMFEESVTRKLPEEADFRKENLELLINAVLDFFSYRNKNRRRINDQFEPMFESAIQQELQSVLEAMIGATPLEKPPISIDNVALFLSWAIFGTALNWSHDPSRQTKESITKQLVAFAEATTSRI